MAFSGESRRFATASATLLGGAALAAPLAAAYAATAARLLGPAAYGTMAAALALGTLASVFGAPLETWVSRAAAEAHGRGDRPALGALSWGLLRRAGPPAAALTAALLVAALALRGAFLAATAWALLSIVSAIPRGVLRGDHRFRSYGLTQLLDPAARFACGAALLVLGLGDTGAVLGYAAGVLASLLLAIFLLRDLRGLPPGAVPQVPRDSAVLFATHAWFLFAASVDVLAARRFLPAEQAGLYGAASALCKLIPVAATPFAQVLLSRIAAQRIGGPGGRVLAARVVGGMAALLVLSTALPWLFGPQILRLAFGSAFAGGAPALRILWIAGALIAWQALQVAVLLGEQRLRGAWLLWVAAAVELGALWAWHATAAQIAAAAAIGAAAGWVAVALGRPRGRAP